nr:hypothetical protein [Prevotella intermedia]
MDNQEVRFGVPKSIVLQGKSSSVTLQKSRFRNAKAQVPLFKDFIFTKLEGFWGCLLKGVLDFLGELESLEKN